MDDILWEIIRVELVWTAGSCLVYKEQYCNQGQFDHLVMVCCYCEFPAMILVDVLVVQGNKQTCCQYNSLEASRGLSQRNCKCVGVWVCLLHCRNVGPFLFFVGESVRVGKVLGTDIQKQIAPYLPLLECVHPASSNSELVANRNLNRRNNLYY